MKVKYHFCVENRRRLVSFLDKYDVPYEAVPAVQKGNGLCVFDVYEEDESYVKLKRQFPLMTLSAMKTREYSKTDISNAKWLRIWAKGNKVQVEWEEKSFDLLCPYKNVFGDTGYRHDEQTDSLSVAKAVKWGTRQFFSGPNSADDMIFCSEKAKNLLGDKWQGLEFLGVKKSNTQRYIPDLYQLFFKEHLPIEAVKGGYRTMCRYCGKEIVRFKHDDLQELKIDRNFLENPYKVYSTGSVLVCGRTGYRTFSINIVSQQFYQYCEANHLNRGLAYEPVELEEPAAEP